MSVVLARPGVINIKKMQQASSLVWAMSYGVDPLAEIMSGGTTQGVPMTASLLLK